MTQWPGSSFYIEHRTAPAGCSGQAMSEPESHTNDSSPAETPSSAVWAVSVVFWCTLLLSAVLYGLVAVAPRLSAWMQVRHHYITHAHRLQALEKEVDYLERVRDALCNDPEFVHRLTAASIAEDSGRGEVIPVSGTLIFGSSDELEQRMPEVDAPLGASLVQWFAADQRLRRGVITTACVLVMFSFTVLNGNGGWFVQLVSRTGVAAMQWPLQRYRREVEPHETDE